MSEQSQTLSASTGAGTGKKDAGAAAGTAGLALSPDPARTPEAGSSTTLNAKNVATPGELCGFVSTLGLTPQLLLRTEYELTPGRHVTEHARDKVRRHERASVVS